MPGHKGHGRLGVEAFDLTEIDGADVLYHENGIILESESLASSLFGTQRTFYSTEGSTLAIKAMLAAVATFTGKRRIIAARNVHKAFVYGCALLDLSVRWLFDENGDGHFLSCRISAEQLERALEEEGDSVAAVYLTSPDYLGVMADVEGIARVCHAHGVLLLVDNAHGAYLAHLEPSLHPIALGADMCADSAHKTLPVLTGGAYLHISRNAPMELVEHSQRAMRLFASTSPSYLILASLDLCNEYILNSIKPRLARAIGWARDVRALCKELGIPLVDSDEPLKISIRMDDAVKEAFSAHGICPEMCDGGVTVLMLSSESTQSDVERLCRALKDVKVARSEEKSGDARVMRESPRQIMSIREAVLAKSERVLTRDAIGRVCAAPVVSCPPAVPIVVSGELITERAAELSELYGYNSIEVVL